MGTICRNCEKPLEHKSNLCQRCGSWTLNDGIGGAIGTVSKNKTTTLDKILPEAVARAKVGEPWDECFGGGIVWTSTTLIGGPPGCLSGTTLVNYQRGARNSGRRITLHDMFLKFNGQRVPGIRGPNCRWTDLTMPTFLQSYYTDGTVARNRVVGVFEAGVKPVIRVGFSNGQHLVLTADHTILTPNGSEIAAGHLKVGDVVLAQGTMMPGESNVRVKSIRPAGKEMTYDVQMESPAHNFAANGIFVHNSGKTTGLLQILSALAELTGRRSYYLSAEQGPGDLRLTVDRLGLHNIDRFRVLSEFGVGAEIDEALLKEDPPAAMVVDSVSALCGKDVHAAIIIAKRFKIYATKWKAPAFLICHMTKEHDFAGLMALQHEVDALVTMFPEDDGTRSLKPWKNRNGSTHSEYKLVMTERGLVAPPPKPEKKQKKLMGVKPPPEPVEEPVRVKAVKKPPPDAITQDGQKLVRRPKKDDRAKAIEGEALKKRRPPMLKTKGETRA